MEWLIKYLLFCVWILSLNLFLRFIHLCVVIYFLFPLLYSICCLYIAQLIFSIVDGLQILILWTYITCLLVNIYLYFYWIFNEEEISWVIDTFSFFSILFELAISFIPTASTDPSLWLLNLSDSDLCWDSKYHFLVRYTCTHCLVFPNLNSGFYQKNKKQTKNSSSPCVIYCDNGMLSILIIQVWNKPSLILSLTILHLPNS